MRRHWVVNVCKSTLNVTPCGMKANLQPIRKKKLIIHRLCQIKWEQDQLVYKSVPLVLTPSINATVHDTLEPRLSERLEWDLVCLKMQRAVLLPSHLCDIIKPPIYTRFPFSTLKKQTEWTLLFWKLTHDEKFPIRNFTVVSIAYHAKW